MNPHRVTRDFEQALCDYTGARFAVTTNSCTMALLLACAWHAELLHRSVQTPSMRMTAILPDVRIPTFTYVGVPQSVLHAGFRIHFEDIHWLGEYRLNPLPVWDSARLFTSDMYRKGAMQCVSFHWSKTLGIQQGGAILHDNEEADEWLRRARFDGRKEGVAPKDDHGIIRGWHCYMSPEVAAEGLVRLSFLPRDNEPLPNSDYPDLSQLECFK